MEVWFNPSSGVSELTRGNKFGNRDFDNYMQEFTQIKGALWDQDRDAILASIIVYSQLPRKVY